VTPVSPSYDMTRPYFSFSRPDVTRKKPAQRAVTWHCHLLGRASDLTHAFFVNGDSGEARLAVERWEERGVLWRGIL
jgi:hypothetical protein